MGPIFFALYGPKSFGQQHFFSWDLARGSLERFLCKRVHCPEILDISETPENPSSMEKQRESDHLRDSRDLGDILEIMEIPSRKDPCHSDPSFPFPTGRSDPGDE